MGTNDKLQPIPSNTSPAHVIGIEGTIKNRRPEGPVSKNPIANMTKPIIRHTRLCILFKTKESTNTLKNEYTKGWIQKYSPKFSSFTPSLTSLCERIGSSNVYRIRLKNAAHTPNTNNLYVNNL